MTFELRSPAFAEGSTIPKKYSGDGENLSPPLQWAGAPSETRSFALICEDPDAPSGIFRHWAAANIDAERTGMPEGGGTQPSGCVFARNDFGHAAYDGPAPPVGHGLHHYHFKVAALDIDRLDVPPDTSAEQLWRTVQPHIVAEAETVGTYRR